MANAAVAERGGASGLVLLGAGVLVISGVYLAKRKPPSTKRPGDSLLVGISFRHRGQGEGIWAGIGWGEPHLLGREVTNITYVTATIGTDADWKTYKVPHKTTVPNLPAGVYDVFVFLQRVGGTLRSDGEGFVKARWYDGRVTITE